MRKAGDGCGKKRRAPDHRHSQGPPLDGITEQRMADAPFRGARDQRCFSDTSDTLDSCHRLAVSLRSNTCRSRDKFKCLPSCYFMYLQARNMPLLVNRPINVPNKSGPVIASPQMTPIPSRSRIGMMLRAGRTEDSENLISTARSVPLAWRCGSSSAPFFWESVDGRAD